MRNVFVEMEKLRNLNSGLGQFCLHLGNEFSNLSPKKLSLNFYLPSTQRNIFGEKFKYIDHSQLHKLFPSSSKNIDVWHCIHQGSKYLPSSKKTKLILTIHDLNFLQKYSGLKRKSHLSALQKKVDRASAITVISKYTEGIVLENLKIKDIPLSIIHNGNSLKHFPSASKPSFAPNGKFIFSIGIIAAKKNFHVLVPLLEKLKDVSLVIAGENKSAYAEEIKALAKKLKVSQRLIMPGIITDEQKYWLYKNCEAFVFPSLAEGFGLPVVEAMNCGKPVFLSDSSSLPEIGGKDAFYWNDFDADNMKTVFEIGMKEFSSDPSAVQKNINRSKLFSWRSAAEKYLELYQSV